MNYNPLETFLTDFLFQKSIGKSYLCKNSFFERFTARHSSIYTTQYAVSCNCVFERIFLTANNFKYIVIYKKQVPFPSNFGYNLLLRFRFRFPVNLPVRK